MALFIFGGPRRGGTARRSGSVTDFYNNVLCSVCLDQSVRALFVVRRKVRIPLVQKDDTCIIRKGGFQREHRFFPSGACSIYLVDNRARPRTRIRKPEVVLLAVRQKIRADSFFAKQFQGQNASGCLAFAISSSYAIPASEQLDYCGSALRRCRLCRCAIDKWSTCKENQPFQVFYLPCAFVLMFSAIVDTNWFTLSNTKSVG